MDLTSKEFAELSGETPHNVRQLCERGRIPGAYKIDGPAQGMWFIPAHAKPIKYKRGRKVGWRKPKKD